MDKEKVITLRNMLKAGKNLPLRVHSDNNFAIIDESLPTQFTIWDDENGVIMSFRLRDPQSDHIPDNRGQAVTLFAIDYDFIQGMEVVYVPLADLDAMFNSIITNGVPMSDNFQKRIKHVYKQILDPRRYSLSPTEMNVIVSSYDRQPEDGVYDAVNDKDDYYYGKFRESWKETHYTNEYNEQVRAIREAQRQAANEPKYDVKITISNGDVNSLIETLDSLSNSHNKALITITEDIELPSVLQIPEGADVTLNLNGNKFIVPEPVNNRSIYAIDNYGTLTLTGDTYIEARGIENFGTMTIENGVEIVARDTNGGAAIWNEGDLTINGGTFRTTHVGSSSDSYGAGCINNRGTAVIHGGEFLSVNKRTYSVISSGNITIDDNDAILIHGAHGGLAIDAGSATILGGDYISTEYYGLYVSNDGTGTPEKAQVTVRGGTFDGKTYSVYIGSDSGRPVDSIINIYGGMYKDPLTAQKNVIDGAGIKLYGGSYTSEPNTNMIADNHSIVYDDNNNIWSIIEN